MDDGVELALEGYEDGGVELHGVHASDLAVVHQGEYLVAGLALVAEDVHLIGLVVPQLDGRCPFASNRHDYLLESFLGPALAKVLETIREAEQG